MTIGNHKYLKLRRSFNWLNKKKETNNSRYFKATTGVDKKFRANGLSP